MKRNRLLKSLYLASASYLLIAGASEAGDIKRIATVPLKAEITGIYLHGDDLFFNSQHPHRKIDGPFSKATIGVVANADFSAPALAPAQTKSEKIRIRTSLGDYQILAQEADDDIAGVISSTIGEALLISNDPDFNAFLSTSDTQGYLFTNWENRPGGMSRLALTRDDDGSYQTGDLEMLDFSSVRGTWVNCFGTLSPWRTPLTSEELYFDGTEDWNNPAYKYHKDQEMLARYLADGSFPNPYDYGYIVEITEPAGSMQPVKHFAMGRFSHENAVIMPDQKTAYLSDDGTGTVFFKFVADAPQDLSAGTLYAAKATQDGPRGAPSATTGFDIEWIELAHGQADVIAGWIREYDGISPADHIAGETNYITDQQVALWALGKANDDRVAFLESRKAAQAKGATAEWRKMEGVNINLEAASDGSVPFMYMAMSEISKTMSDGEGHISLEENRCGVVYQMRLDDNYNIARMEPVIAGFGYDRANKPNACPLESIANPDNLVVRRDGSVVIGEDSNHHENNILWLWRPTN